MLSSMIPLENMTPSFLLCRSFAGARVIEMVRKRAFDITSLVLDGGCRSWSFDKTVVIVFSGLRRYFCSDVAFSSRAFVR